MIGLIILAAVSLVLIGGAWLLPPSEGPQAPFQGDDDYYYR
jgi:hypothetical protein